MNSSTIALTISDVAKGINPDNFTLQFWSESGQIQYGYIDDGYGPLWLYESEANGTWIVRCEASRHDKMEFPSDAFEMLYDEFRTAPADELHEAYGLSLMQAKSCFSPDNGEDWFCLADTSFHDDAIGELVSADVLKCTGDRLSVGGPFATREEASAYADEFASEHQLELVEGYHHQSNSSGTGIVWTGHYENVQLLTLELLQRHGIVLRIIAE